MAPTRPNVKILQNIALWLLVTNVRTSLAGDYSGLLSSLYKQASNQERPVILVLDDKSNRNNGKENAHLLNLQNNLDDRTDNSDLEEVQKKKVHDKKPLSHQDSYTSLNSKDRFRKPRYDDRNDRSNAKDYNNRNDDRYNTNDRYDDDRDRNHRFNDRNDDRNNRYDYRNNRNNDRYYDNDYRSDRNYDMNNRNDYRNDRNYNMNNRNDYQNNRNDDRNDFNDNRNNRFDDRNNRYDNRNYANNNRNDRNDDMYYRNADLNDRNGNNYDRNEDRYDNRNTKFRNVNNKNGRYYRLRGRHERYNRNFLIREKNNNRNRVDDRGDRVGYRNDREDRNDRQRGNQRDARSRNVRERNRKRDRGDRVGEEDTEINKLEKSILRSPLVKTLMQISNDYALRQKKDSCEESDSCEVKSVTTTTSTTADACEQSSDSCDNTNNDGNPSTRGIQDDYTAEDSDDVPQGTSRLSAIRSATGAPSSYSIMAMEEAEKYNRRESTQYQFYPGTERDLYEYNYERSGLYKTNLPESIAHLIKGTMGAGVLTMHEAFMYGGIWTSLGVCIFVGFMNFYAMLMLGQSAQRMYGRIRVPKLSYADLAEVSVATGAWKRFRKYSKMFRYTVDSCLVLWLGGNCCIFQIMIASTFKVVLENVSKDASKWLHDDIRLFILACTPLLLVLCLIRSLKILAPFSLVADVFVGMCVVTTLYYSLQTDGKVMDRPAWKNISDFMRFFGVCVYCSCGIGVCLPIENNMKRPYYFPFVLWCAMIPVVLMTTATGFFGYWGWGETCKSPITTHMPKNMYTIILQFLLGLMLCVTFAVQFWVPSRIIWHYLKCRRRVKIISQSVLEKLHRFLFGVLLTCVSLLFPKMLPVMSFIGHFFLGLIAFVFPAVIESLITWRDDRRRNIRWRVSKNFVLIIFGFSVSGTAFYLDW